MTKDLKLYLIYILDAIRECEDYSAGDENTALEDLKTRRAIERVLETLADATRHIPDHIKKEYPHIEWSKIIGFRNILAHDYLGVDHIIIVDILKYELPDLKTAIEEILKKYE